ncbi:MULTISPECIES: hypothetical protein [Streptomyces]|uniref:Lipoprotein n=2 Tax=Streptomyces TaxID=1883 RepID=A0ABQ3NNM1_STRVG|nr:MULTISPECIES: hypothetical protein [Streptomyces]KOU14416.1 hypothetical protein ADK49_23125 [Streptomyces sp. WM6349]KOU82438.1 hypothetical protein ADK94_23835 [Streptomyces sp. XY593]KOU93944.1 hypothetical protein ADK92_23925 [Streptomyces sp. XY533]KOV01549.1 hypothetical protein ADK91_22925 [Streptomyces sp. XY511]KOV41207.1 hypothetical protein ADK98_27385 [Streptomyces sp. H036]
MAGCGESGDGAGGAWQASVVKYRRGAGRPAYGAARAPGPLARRDGLSVLGRTGEVRCVDSSGRVLWTAACSGVPNAAHISGGRVLVTTDSLDYTPWGHLGPALLLDLADGAPVAELRGASGAVLSGGRFFLGLEGYDVFDTWEYDRDGALVDSWRSYGHYVTGTGIRVVETDRNLPTGSRVVRLLPGGAVERGPALTDPLCPEPLVLADGTILVLDAGVLRAVDRRLGHSVLAELLPVDPDQTWRCRGGLRRSGDRLTVTLAEEHRDRPGKQVVHTWTLALRPGPAAV